MGTCKVIPYCVEKCIVLHIHRQNEKERDGGKKKIKNFKHQMKCGIVDNLRNDI